MSVLIETSLGDLTIDLLIDTAPRACENFLKLCKIKYYNFAPVHTVQKGFSLQTGDPLGPASAESDGGSSIWGLLRGPSQKTFPVKLDPKLKHEERGTVSMATVASERDPDERLVGSQFLISLDENIEYLDGRGLIFGKVVEGFDTLEKINEAFTDTTGRPLKDIRIKHTVILDDPYDDPPGLVEPDKSPPPSKAQLATVLIADDEDLDETMDEESLEKLRREREARAQALTLEMVGDLPFAEVKPPENVLFVCKLNPVTHDEDLELIFSRFGKILSCEIIRDKRTGESLQYAFIEFENRKDSEQAYFKMQGVLIDDHRIHVDFSQSVSKLSDTWRDATNAKRRTRGGGFGGIDSLQRKRHYRDEVERNTGKGYRMVFDKDDIRRSETQTTSRERSRSRSPVRDRYRDSHGEKKRWRNENDDRRKDDDHGRSRRDDYHRR